VVNSSDSRCRVIKDLFLREYPDSKTELNFQNPFQLLVSVVLSAQCTDKRVNQITPQLFKEFPTPTEMSLATTKDMHRLIGSCSFFQNKSKYLVELSRQLIESYGGEVPLDRDELQKLRGVGRKTANVVLIELLEANFMAVDTHVFRTSHRLNLSDSKTVDGTEKDLTLCFKSDLAKLHQAMVLFGRYICKARNPECQNCFLKEQCNSEDRRLP
jgi:endonuclease-3